MSIIANNANQDRKRSAGWRFNRFLERYLPADLYRRSLIIVIAPMVLLQSIMAGIFLDRHLDNVTKTLSRSVAREMAFIVNVYETLPRTPDTIHWLETVANEKLALGLKIEQDTTLPPPAPKPFFSLVDQKLSKYIARYIGKPFWLDTIGKSGFVDVRIQASDGVIFRFLTDQDRATPANTYIFLLWMIGSALILLIVAVRFLRRQISPIVQLAEAAQSFGMGREIADYEPRGASEVRDAGHAFMDMKRRIERHVEQRTAMLAGVSHDMRTILTRFKLELAVTGDLPQAAALKQDVEEMERMIEGYIAFVRGDGGENSRHTDIYTILTGIKSNMKRADVTIDVNCATDLSAAVKPDAFKRCIANLVTNAARFATIVEITGSVDGNYLFVTVEDNGPGIAIDKREDVFRPFFRLDDARNQDEFGTGLGLAIARDIAQSHGGNITLDESTLGGLSASVRIPIQ